MNSKDIKIQKIHALVVASCLGMSLSVFGDLGDLLIKRDRMTESLSKIIKESHLELHKSFWFPHNVADIESYFSYHKDVEVYQMMKYLNKLLGWGFSDFEIRDVSYFHDLAKVTSYETLVQYGYQGWAPDIALPFLKVILRMSEEEIEKHLEKNEFGNFKVDFKTRLLFSFSLSDATITTLFPDPDEQLIIKEELKSLRSGINYYDEKLAEARPKDSYYSRLSSERKKRIHFLEHSADWIVRTENNLARIEYYKIFEKSSDLLLRQGESSFIYKILSEKVGPQILAEFGMDGLIEMFKLGEAAYIGEVIEISKNEPASGRARTIWNHYQLQNFPPMIVAEYFERIRNSCKKAMVQKKRSR